MPDVGRLKQIDTGQVHIISVKTQPLHAMKIDTAIINWDGDPYHGPYEVTPTAGTQILHTENMHMNHDVVINPIPSDWGHITWDGAVLTVS